MTLPLKVLIGAHSLNNLSNSQTNSFIQLIWSLLDEGSPGGLAVRVINNLNIATLVALN